MGEPERHRVPAALPAGCVARERVVQSSFYLYLMFWGTLHVAGLIFVAWLVEYSFNEINFAHWLTKRWYVLLGIVVLTSYGYISEVMKRNVAWRELCALSTKLSGIALSADGPHATGSVTFGGTAIGQRTITCGRNGLTIWKLGEPKAYFPWNRFKGIFVRKTPKRLFADIRLEWRTPSIPPTLSVPWSMDMDSTVPPELDLVRQ